MQLEIRFGWNRNGRDSNLKRKKLPESDRNMEVAEKHSFHSILLIPKRLYC